MALEAWTTGQTSGITHIPPQTLRRYVKDFQSYFSETARQPNKGRRFTRQDIDNLLLIRHLYNDNCSSEKITAALAGEWTPEAKPQYDNQDALTLFANVQEHASEIKALKREFERLVSASEHTFHRFNKVIESHTELKHQAPFMAQQIASLEKQLADLQRQVTALQEEKRKGFRLFGG